MNTAHGAFKLSIRRIVCDTFLIPWRHKRAFITPLILPGLLMAVITLGWLLTRGKMPEAASWLLFGVYWVSFGIFAVACHRLVLLGPSPTTLAVRLTLGLREIRFIVWLALIGVIYALVYFLSVLGILNSLLLGETITGAHASKMGQAHINAAQYVALVVATFVFARFSLILPAVALDQKVSLHWAWQRSEHNGWRLAVTIGVFPPVLAGALGFLLRSSPTVVEIVVVTLLSIITTMLGVIALSLSYQDLEAGLAGIGQRP